MVNEEGEELLGRRGGVTGRKGRIHEKEGEEGSLRDQLPNCSHRSPCNDRCSLPLEKTAWHGNKNYRGGQESSSALR